MDARAEFTYDKFETKLNDLEPIKYSNYVAGLALHYRLYPFNKKSNFTKGITLEPAIHWRQYIWSTLDDNYNYKSNAGDIETHNPYNFGVFANVTLAYTFGL